MAMMRLRREDPRVVGTFKLHRRLGAGGMGVVYLGSDRRGQRVALKVIRPDLAEDQEFRSRFAREVSAARRIRGGCTARLVAADLDATRPWFATQYVPGPSLHDKVAESGPLSAAETAAVGAALAEGLVAVHEAGVVHRDLKPSNILLSPKGPRIIDFGIAWSTGASTLTHVGTAVGSPGFLAPEQVRGQPVTPASDVFSLGATLAYATLGDSPFGQGSSEVMLYRVVHEEPQLRGVPAALAPLLRACLAKSPQERPSTLQLSLRLKEIAAREARGLGPSASRPAAAPARPPGPRRPAGAGPARGGARQQRPRSGARRAADRRLLRQRLIVFVTVTLLVALGIAAAQGCQGPV
ncbi:serine/threonine-protein kinase [Streptomyces litchfieldiae]|uniref:Serine/threonine-protein kinase n=1 Tax=Streptomyces litchfieldiae TaxID=3075543 RepID=A0ABU2MVF6_9ACTN|nr:serine/threonine-protein kinase [Streptomyces sp. DSM 44938]MDT0345589.1 serine/threonine-protein kinase [Streptomyces sp. DSM 44938]